MSTWQEKAASKRTKLLSSIPAAWILPPPTNQSPRPNDVRGIPKECGILNEKELVITDEDEIEVVLNKVKMGEWSSEEVVTAYCKRAAVAQQLTCCLTEPLFDRAIARAKELDEHLRSTGEVVGPLHGLPISVKEQFDIKGVESTMCFVSRIGFISQESATMVTLLESLGAVIHCKTHVPQTLLCDESVSNVFGRTLNPWNTDLTAGGSSGGEAALLAMKGSPIGVGTDLGGSIRKPSSFCGLYSLRPTSRRLPYHGASNIFLGAEALESVCGPMARSLNSVAKFMSAIVDAKPWELDAKVVERPWAGREDVKEKKCFAVMWNDGLVKCHPPLERGLNEVAAKLREAGHEVVEWTPLDHAGAQEIVSQIFDADGGEDMRQLLGDSGEPILPQIFTSQHPAMSMHQSWQLNKKRDAYRQLFLQTWMSTKARQGGTTGRPVDAIICAMAPHLAAPHLETPRPGGLITYTTVWSLLDLPCYTFPVGVVDPAKDPQPEPGSYKPLSEVDKENWEGYSPELYENAPIVLQLVGPRRFAEDELLGLGRDIEVALGK
ncbi:amidase [Meredithblackwellia eburnea MCA 4105]